MKFKNGKKNFKKRVKIWNKKTYTWFAAIWNSKIFWWNYLYFFKVTIVDAEEDQSNLLKL